MFLPVVLFGLFSLYFYENRNSVKRCVRLVSGRTMTETSFGAVETEDGATNKLLTVNLNFVAMSG